MRFKLYTLAALTCSILGLFQEAAFAQLTVGDPTMYGTKPAYIDNAKIVVEPHGAFTEQTMYLVYADHDAYPGDNDLEIVQRFTLPEGAVIDNLWLWIGDTLV